MKDQDIIMINSKELKRLHIVKMYLEKKIKQKEAAGLLGLSTRQVRRITSKIEAEGDKAVVHKLKGKPSNRSKPAILKEKVLNLYGSKYHDFGPTLAQEKLAQIDNIKIGKETLRSWLVSAGLHKKKRKPRPHRMYRERKNNFGQMVQIDGSIHHWFEDRGPKCSFMGYIDDATSTVYGRFYTHEGTIPAMDSFSRYTAKYGLPVSVYIDKHTIYRSTARPTVEEELSGISSQSQFQRALHELEVEIIYANSPQAKGRVERLFGTLQDRLVKELRLAKIDNIKDANKFLEGYLPIHNRRFSVPALGSVNMHRKPPQATGSMLCIKEKRTLRNDNTISYNGNLYQILDNIFFKKVGVEKHLDGNIYIKYNGKSLRYSKIDKIDKKETAENKDKVRVSIKPKPYHPWRGKTKGRGVLATRI